MTPEHLRSAGGVVLRIGNSGLEVLVLHRIQPDEWRLPKGKIRAGEQPEAAALREVREESGVLAEILGLAGETEHTFTEDGRDFLKRTTYYVMRQLSPTTALADPDFDQAVWLAPDEAAQRLTFENERAMVRRTAEIFGASH